MKNMMEYKGYFGSVNYDDEERIFYGKVEYIRSLISYEENSVESLRNSFYEAADDYLNLVKEKISNQKSHLKVVLILKRVKKFIDVQILKPNKEELI